MTPPSSDEPEKSEPAPNATPLFASLADAARRLLRGDERRPVGGLSRGRVGAAPQGAELTIPVSSFQMIGLGEVQAKLAERWPAVAAKVHMIAQNTIAKHLVRGDVFEPHGEDGYLVLFATLGAAEAEFKSRVIAREIVQHLLGEGEAQDVNLSTRCTVVSATALANGDHETVLSEALARARAPADGFAPPNQPSPAVPATPDENGRAPSRPQAAGEEPIEEPTGSQIHAYSPVWDVAQMTMLRFRAFAPSVAARPDGAWTDEAEAFHTDLALIEAVSRDLKKLARQGRRLPVTIALRHSSLGSGSQRAQIRHALAQTPAELRRLVTVELCWPEDQFWTYACKALLEGAQSLGVGWSAVIDLENPRAIPASGGWLRGVGAAVWGQERTENEALKLLAAFGARARGQGLDCAAYDLGSRALVLGAVGAGFRYLAGPAIHADARALTSAVRFEPLDLYADLKARRA